MKLHDLHPTVRRPKKKRLGLGDGSGQGGTAGRGHKGQKARSGVSSRPHFEGGQITFFRRLPKHGFNHPRKVNYYIVNVSVLDKFFEANETVDSEALRKKGVIGSSKGWGLKILANGEIGKALKVKASKFSEGAKSKIEAAGGSCETL
jgi:large subunit ribosomal protein L15